MWLISAKYMGIKLFSNGDAETKEDFGKERMSR
jgi:hypothetical protein